MNFKPPSKDVARTATPDIGASGHVRNVSDGDTGAGPSTPVRKVIGLAPGSGALGTSTFGGAGTWTPGKGSSGGGGGGFGGSPLR